MHYNLPGTRSILFDSGDSLPGSVGSPAFENTDELADVLVDGNAPLVLTGHVYFPAAGTMGGVRELTLPSLGPHLSSYTISASTRGNDCDDTLGRGVRGVESFILGVDQSGAQLAAAQLAGLPLVGDLSGNTR